MSERDKGQPRNRFHSQENPRPLPESKSSPFEPGWEDIPHEEMVERMKQTIADAKARFEARYGEGTFDPVEWAGFILAPPFQSKPSKQERDLALVWDAISEPYLKSQDFRQRIRAGIDAGSRLHGRYITLEPKAVKLLDVMTDALNIPHKGGDTTFDLLKDVPPPLQRKPHTARRILSYIAREMGVEIDKTVNQLLSIDKKDDGGDKPKLPPFG